MVLLTSCNYQPKQQSDYDAAPANCTQGWECIADNKKAYLFSDCTITQENLCPYGCKEGECLTQKLGPKYALTEGMGRMKDLGWKSADFSEGQFLINGVKEIDVKLELKTGGYNSYNAASEKDSIWKINRKITEAERDDCIYRKADASTDVSLATGETLCILTGEGNIAMVGGFWTGSVEPDTKLYWKYYS